MNLEQLQSALIDVPREATEIVIKGRDATELFFTMPADWRPQTDRIRIAPNPTSFAKAGGKRWNRWRVS